MQTVQSVSVYRDSTLLFIWLNFGLLYTLHCFEKLSTDFTSAINDTGFHLVRLLLGRNFVDSLPEGS